MKLAFMRRVDYWIGIPLVSLVTLWVFFQDFIRGLRRKPERRRVLFIELSEMGSAILADPALRRVKSRHEIFFLIFKRNVLSLDVFKTVPEEHVFTLRDSSFLLMALDSVRFLIWCRKVGINAVVDLELFSRFTAILSGLSGAEMRLGFHNLTAEGLYRGRVLTHPIYYNPHIHIAKSFIALTEPLLPSDMDQPGLVKRPILDHEIQLAPPQISEEAKLRVHDLLKLKTRSLSLTQPQILIVNPNAGDLLPQRKWPVDYFERLIRLLLASNPNWIILLTGSPSEKEFVVSLEKSVAADRCISVAGETQFADLPALYQKAECIITNDSGPAHFASASGLLTFVLFGPETPALYGPIQNAVAITAGLACSPCVSAANHRDTPCRNPKCMQEISPEAVFSIVQRHLDRPEATARSRSEIVHLSAGATL